MNVSKMMEIYLYYQVEMKQITIELWDYKPSENLDLEKKIDMANLNGWKNQKVLIQ
jgi:hypothetical protein